MSALMTFVCWGNICRSTMGEQIARQWASREGLAIEVDSAGVSSEEIGNPIDPRAAKCLATYGYDKGTHRAQRADRDLIERSDMVIAFEPLHVTHLKRTAPDADNIYLITEFIPGATPGSGVKDPWYGDMSDFEQTFEAITAAMPGIMETMKDVASL